MPTKKTTKTSAPTSSKKKPSAPKSRLLRLEGSRAIRFLGPDLLQSPHGKSGDFADAASYLDKFVHAERAESIGMLIANRECAALVAQIVLADAASWGFVGTASRTEIDFRGIYLAVVNGWATYETSGTLESAAAAVDRELDDRFGVANRFGHRSKNGFIGEGEGRSRLERMVFFLRALASACWTQAALADETFEIAGRR